MLSGLIRKVEWTKGFQDRASVRLSLIWLWPASVEGRSRVATLLFHLPFPLAFPPISPLEVYSSRRIFQNRKTQLGKPTTLSILRRAYLPLARSKSHRLSGSFFLFRGHNISFIAVLLHAVTFDKGSFTLWGYYQICSNVIPPRCRPVRAFNLRSRTKPRWQIRLHFPRSLDLSNRTFLPHPRKYAVDTCRSLVQCCWIPLDYTHYSRFVTIYLCFETVYPSILFRNSFLLNLSKITFPDEPFPVKTLQTGCARFSRAA